jgi:DNA-directed RNA polymerase subunit beta
MRCRFRVYTIYLSAEEEEGMLISQANIEMDNSGKLLAENVIARQEEFSSN